MKERQAFTLVELLVVIAIIAALAAILFPVFGSSREKARQVTCMSNQHQLALLIIQHAQDHDTVFGVFPPAESIWEDLKPPKKLLICPLAGKKVKNAYVINYIIPGKPIDIFKNPADTALTMDGSHAAADLPDSYDNIAYTESDLLKRHQGEFIVSYLDGHVAKTAKLPKNFVQEVTADNVDPIVRLDPDVTIDEGGTITSSGDFTDPDANTWTATVDYGDGSALEPLELTPEKTFILSHRYTGNGVYTVTVTVTDDKDGAGSASMEVTVRGRIIRRQVSTNHNQVGGDDETVSLMINTPSPVTKGDFLLAQISFTKGSIITSITPPAGWTQVRRNNFSSDIGQALFYRIGTAEEPASYTWQFRKDSSFEKVRATGGIIRYTGVDTGNPIVASSGAVGDSTSLTAPGVIAEERSMLVGFFTIMKHNTLSTPAGMSNAYFIQHPNQSGTASRAADEERTSAGATGSKTSTAAVKEKWVAQLIVLRAE